MFRKSIVSGCLALLILLTGLTGCSLTRELAGGVVKELKENEDGIRRELVELWNGFLDEVNDWAEAAARRSVTEDAALKGERRKGADNYTGSYEADYERFTGEEYIFGGTVLKRRNGNDLRAVYSLSVQSGTAALYWLDGEEEHLIADASGSGRYEFTIHAGGNFIVLKGEDFTGGLSLTVEE